MSAVAPRRKAFVRLRVKDYRAKNVPGRVTGNREKGRGRIVKAQVKLNGEEGAATSTKNTKSLYLN